MKINFAMVVVLLILTVAGGLGAYGILLGITDIMKRILAKLGLMS
jgi:hypothetical protein